MSKKFLKWSYEKVFWLSAKICNYETYRKIQVRKNVFFSYWLSMQFENAGKDLYFEGVSLLMGRKCISIGDYTAFGEHLYLTAWQIVDNSPKIEIGKNCNFGAFNHITCYNRVIIGSGVLTGKWVTITDNSHGDTELESLLIPPMQRNCISKGPVVIEDNVWIGDKVTILPNTTIGKGAVIAANTVVTKNIPPYSVVAGNPAKVIKVYKREEAL